MAQTNVDIILRARDEASAKLKAIANDMGGVVGSVQRLGFALGASGAAIAGIATTAAGLTKLVQNYSQVAEQLQNLSAATGVSTTNLQVFQKAIVVAGGSADEAAVVLKHLNKALDENDPLLRKIGASGLSTWDALRKLSDAFANSEAGSARQTAAFKLLGRNADTALAVLSKGSRSLDEFGAKLRSMGATMSDKAVANFAKFDDQLDQLGLRFEAIKLAIAEGVVPWLVRMLNVLEYIRINAVSLVPTLQLLAHSIDFLNSIMSNPFDFKGRAAIGRQMAEDALAIARAAVNAKRELEGLKDLVSSLGNARAPHFGGGPAPFSLESLAGFSDAGSDAKLRAGGAQRLQVGPMLDDARFKLISLGEIIDRMAGNWVRAFQTFGQSVQSGIVSVFENLGNRAQTFRTAMVSIFESMALGVQRAIGQLLGSLAVKGLLSLLGTALSFLTGNPFISLGAQALGGGLGANLVAQSPSAQMSARSGPSGGGNTFVIQTISAKDVLQSLLSPRGVMRAANDRILEVAAAS